MNIPDIQRALALRLHRVMEQVYERPVAGSPELPCVIIGFPTVESFHVDYAHEITQMSLDIEVIVGRGDANDGYDRLAKLISTDDNSIVEVLEDPDDRYPDPPWLRLRCRGTDTPNDRGDGIGLTLNVELHA